MSLVADRILNLAVEKVRTNCRNAMYTTPVPGELHPLTQVHAANLDVLNAALVAAELVMAADLRSAVVRSRAIPEQRNPE